MLKTIAVLFYQLANENRINSIVTYRSFQREKMRSLCCHRRPRLIGPDDIESNGMRPVRLEFCYSKTKKDLNQSS